MYLENTGRKEHPSLNVSRDEPQCTSTLKKSSSAKKTENTRMNIISGKAMRDFDEDTQHHFVNKKHKKLRQTFERTAGREE